MAIRLSSAVLSKAAKDIQLPNYDRNQVRAGIVHLGVGAFHRAHQAVYVDNLLREHPQWGIIGASLRRPDTYNALNPQDCLYTLAVRDVSGTSCRIVGSVLSIINAADQRERLLEVMATDEIRIISLTITEKGYCHDPATGQLDQTHPDILHDLAYPQTPKSAPGLIVEAASRRRDIGIAPFTVMSCDNLPSNGITARQVISQFARLRDTKLGHYVSEKVAFPSTMVDRIVPATTIEDRTEISEMLGFEDAWPVVTEPFIQWVIEDDFPGGRPPFEMVGAQMVSDVEPFERMKLRMLNGTHSTLAYLGYLAGFKTVSEVVANPRFLAFLHDLMSKEIIPTLNMPCIDLLSYRDALLSRFSNPALRHNTWQIAMDGSQKLPQRLLDTIRDRISNGQSYERLALGVAAWIRYASGIDEAGQVIDVRDPLAEEFQSIVQSANGDCEELVKGFLELQVVFGTDLPNDKAFVGTLNDKVTLLTEKGGLSAINSI